MKTKLTPVCPIADYSPRRGTQGKILACWLTVLALALTMAAGRAQTFTVLKSFGFLTNVTGNHPQSTVVQGPDGTLYGTTSISEGPAGTVFKVQPDGSGFTVLKWFTNSIEGANPVAGLTLSGSTLYGTTAGGGSSNFGTVFSVNTDGTSYAVLKNFTGSDGLNPGHSGLTLSGSVLYGTTYYGGSSGNGTVFRVNTDGTGFSNLHSFTALDPYSITNSDGANPNFSLTLSGSVLYGTTENAGGSGYGTVFKVNTDGTGFTVLKNFAGSPDGAYPDCVLTLSGSTLYGTTYGGGSYYNTYYNAGTVFRVNTDGTGYSVLKTFTNSLDGANPSGSLPLSGNVLYGTTSQPFGDGTVFKLNTDGTGYAVLKNFNHSDGVNPYAGLALSGSVLYGTTYYGGSSYGGTVFKVSTDGTGFTVLKSFANSSGGGPKAVLALSGSVLYGTTYAGGSSYSGTVFKVNTDGTSYTVLKDFTNFPDGAYPNAGMTLSGSVLYGTTYAGGSSNVGTVFKVNTDGTGYSHLKDFANSDGANTYSGLTLSGSVLYGTTYAGGSSNYGTVFKLNTDGTGYTVLKSFNGSPDGNGPSAGLALSGSVLYGTTWYGGAFGQGEVFRVNTDGTGYTVLKNFSGSPDGARPFAGLALSGSVLYGTTFQGGTLHRGTAFKLNTDGTGYTILKMFSRSDGAGPLAVLTLSGSTLYGTTANGGSSDNGAVFQVNTDGTGYTVLKSFTGSDGAYPFAGVTLSGSTLYGTTANGGSFGQGVVFSLKLPPPAPGSLNIATIPGSVVLSWAEPRFNLQSAPEVTGAYTNIPSATSPYTNAITAGRQFFRLISN